MKPDLQCSTAHTGTINCGARMRRRSTHITSGRLFRALGATEVRCSVGTKQSALTVGAVCEKGWRSPFVTPVLPWTNTGRPFYGVPRTAAVREWCPGGCGLPRDGVRVEGRSALHKHHQCDCWAVCIVRSDGPNMAMTSWPATNRKWQ